MGTVFVPPALPPALPPSPSLPSALITSTGPARRGMPVQLVLFCLQLHARSEEGRRCPRSSVHTWSALSWWWSWHRSADLRLPSLVLGSTPTGTAITELITNAILQPSPCPHLELEPGRVGAGPRNPSSPSDSDAKLKLAGRWSRVLPEPEPLHPKAPDGASNSRHLLPLSCPLGQERLSLRYGREGRGDPSLCGTCNMKTNALTYCSPPASPHLLTLPPRSLLAIFSSSPLSLRELPFQRSSGSAALFVTLLCPTPSPFLPECVFFVWNLPDAPASTSSVYFLHQLRL